MQTRLSRTAHWLALVALSAQLGLSQEAKELTLLYTNDFHSAIDPIPAYWLEGTSRLGVSFQIDGRESSPEASYRVATNSFLADGGDPLVLQRGTARNDTKRPLSQVFIDYLTAQGALTEPTAGRLVLVPPVQRDE